VRGRFIEAKLDHDTGSLSGRVREGRFAGRDLEEMSEAELRELREEIAGDADSVALLEAYFDRRFPGWRDDREEDGHARAGAAADSGAMTDEEAYEILGLPPGADESEIRAAHRRLLKGVHPDQGGSTFLAARINQAKDRLLGKHR
jgi:DnaJ-domain-containing protein 1